MSGTWQPTEEEMREAEAVSHLSARDRIWRLIEAFPPMTPELTEAFEQQMQAIQEAREASIANDLSA